MTRSRDSFHAVHHENPVTSHRTPRKHRPGRLVIFRSRDLLHEVLPVEGWRRAALSVWVLRDARAEV